MKALIAGQVQILSSPSFRSLWASGGFPIHGVGSDTIFLYSGFSGIYIEFAVTNLQGVYNRYWYGPFLDPPVTDYITCLYNGISINGLTGGEFYNRVIRHQLYSKNIPPP